MRPMRKLLAFTLLACIVVAAAPFGLQGPPLF